MFIKTQPYLPSGFFVDFILLDNNPYTAVFELCIDQFENILFKKINGHEMFLKYFIIVKKILSKKDTSILLITIYKLVTRRKLKYGLDDRLGYLTSISNYTPKPFN